MKVIMRATIASAREGLVRPAPLDAAAVVLALDEPDVPDAAGLVEVAPGAPGLEVTETALGVEVDAMTPASTEEGKKETVEPSGSYTPFHATE